MSLPVDSGAFLAIVGPSGSGKSTLLRVAAGLQPVHSGTVVVGGRLLTRLSDAELAQLRRKNIGFLDQTFNLLPELSAEANVGLPLLLDSADKHTIKARVNTALTELGIAEVSDRLPDEMSGGQKLRVALARALVIRPDLLIADEPTGSLDQDSTSMVIELLCKIHRMGSTIVIATHDPAVANAANKTVRLVDGKIVD